VVTKSILSSGITCRLHIQGREVSQARHQHEAGSKHFSILKMEAIFSSETSIDFRRTTRRYTPKDGTIQVVLHLYPVPPFFSQYYYANYESRITGRAIGRETMKQIPEQQSVHERTMNLFY
jgi:hypothetical protein